jgi:glycine cleavage system H protein
MSIIFYTKEHEWIRVNEGGGVVGISAYASEQLGDVVFVELPENGFKANQGDNIAVVESVKAASEVYSPVSGEVIKTNEDLSVSHLSRNWRVNFTCRLYRFNYCNIIPLISFKSIFR